MPPSAPVLLHGFGTSRHLWDAVLPRLDGPALTLDLPGFGDNIDDRRYTVDGMADAVLEAVQAAGLTRYVFVGHSMGGKVAAVLAARRPAGLQGLLLLAPSPPSPEPMTEQGRADLKAAHGHPDRLLAHYRQITRQALPGPVLAQLTADGLRASRDAWTAWPDAGSREHREGEMAAIDVPVHVLTSPDDPVITPQVTSDLLRPTFPGAAFTEVQGSGHLLPLELPEDVAAAIAAAL